MRIIYIYIYLYSYIHVHNIYAHTYVYVYIYIHYIHMHIYCIYTEQQLALHGIFNMIHGKGLNVMYDELDMDFSSGTCNHHDISQTGYATVGNYNLYIDIFDQVLLSQAGFIFR